MDLTSQKAIKELLDNHSTRPKKGLGQCFLTSKKAFEKIIESADLGPNDTVLEIGPGIGNLTLKLAERVKKVIAIEKDPKMCEILKDVLESQNIQNVEIIQEDILRLDAKRYPLGNYKVVANLPYYLTSPAIRKFLETDNPPELMVLMIQKEVAQRICAKVPDMNLLAVSVQFYSTPKIISYVSKKCFWPSPKVDSAIIKLITHNLQLTTDKDLFFQIVRAGFSQPRKQLLNNFSKNLKLNNKDDLISWLLKNNIKPEQRAETLNIEDWINLTKTLPDA
jgi:16S rRNA (adenine1518-N6/adenine1519-N6)-dimethyltransferase